MKWIYKSVILLTLWGLLEGCSFIQESKYQNSDEEISPISSLVDEKYKTISMNAELNLQFFEFEELQLKNDFTIASEIHLALKNNSTDNIWISLREDINIYMLDNGDYVRVDDKIDRSLDNGLMFPPNDEVPFSVIPDIQSKEPVNVMIVVTGTMMDGEEITQKKVGAYIECTLDP